jgi:Fe-S cluster biogenesis protein NfuA
MPKIAEIEFTPNPNAKRFVLKEAITAGMARSFEGREAGASDPLAKALFETSPHVTSVYYVDRYLTVVQDGDVAWPELERQLAVPIREASAADTMAPSEAMLAESKRLTEAMSPADRKRLEAIESLLDEKVRPALVMDGGGLEVMGLAGNRLSIHYQGACGTCPSSITGTLAGIEALVQSIEPDLEVVAV